MGSTQTPPLQFSFNNLPRALGPHCHVLAAHPALDRLMVVASNLPSIEGRIRSSGFQLCELEAMPHLG